MCPNRGRSDGGLLTSAARKNESPDDQADGHRPGRMYADISRELKMLRVGLAEQGNRISVLGAELRDEIGSLGDVGGQSSAFSGAGELAP
jgi:hypothetical protein